MPTRKLFPALGALSLALGLAAAPGFAAARTDYHHHRYQRTTYHHRAYRSCVRHSANQGTVLGAVSGGLLGNVIAGRGSRTGGTLIGAGVGAVAGHQIAKSRARSSC